MTALSKVSPRYVGPFTIQRQISNVTYRLNLPLYYHIALSFHVSLFKPFTNPLIPSPQWSGADDVPSLHPPVDPADENMYKVNTILDS